MEQRDILKDEIERIGKVLAKILSDFLGYKAGGHTAEGIEISNEFLQSEIDVDVQRMMLLNKIELDDYFSNVRWNENHLELLAEYLKEVGLAKRKNEKNDAYLYFQRAIELLEIADRKSKTISYRRINTIKEIKRIQEIQ